MKYKEFLPEWEVEKVTLNHKDQSMQISIKQKYLNNIEDLTKNSKIHQKISK